MIIRTVLRTDFGVRNWNVQTEYRNNVFMATQEKQGSPATSVTQQNLLSPAILVSDIQVNFSTSFECSIARF